MMLKHEKIQHVQEILGDPIIIGHNCGYLDFYIDEPLYSPKATAECLKHASFLEIDVDKKGGAWRYYHGGKPGSIGWIRGVDGGEKYDPTRTEGVRLACFLCRFFESVEEYRADENKKNVPVGLFIDIKSIPWGGGSKKDLRQRLSWDFDISSTEFSKIRMEVEDLMNLIVGFLPRNIDLMLYTGRVGLHPGHSVDPQATAAFLIWIATHAGDKSFRIRVSSIRLVTRHENFHRKERLVNFIKKLNVDIKNRYNSQQIHEIIIASPQCQGENQYAITWGFNPHYNMRRHYNFEEIYDLDGLLIPWTTDIPSDKDNPERWQKVIDWFATKAESYYKEHPDHSRPLSWAFITYKPAEFLEFWDSKKTGNYLLPNKRQQISRGEAASQLQSLSKR